jgi:hypothetical protein
MGDNLIGMVRHRGELASTAAFRKGFSPAVPL